MNRSALCGLLFCVALSACGDSEPVGGSPGSVAPNGPPLFGTSRCGDHPWCETQLSPAERTDLLLAAMTLEQKISLMAGDDVAGVVTGNPSTGTVNGIPELDIPPLYMSDGPVGIREGSATSFPSPLALAASFETTLAYQTGKTIGNESRHKGNDLVHGPVVDVMRVPLAGRIFETYGEDPYLAGRMGAAWIQGLQSEGVIANLKHYLPNTQEGQVGTPALAIVGSRVLVNAVIDERTLREIYMLPFEIAVKEGDTGSLMCAYNYINGSPACSSFHVLQEVLRDEWGFDGFVVSDYILATKDTVQSALNGLEIDMPMGVFYAPQLLQLAVLTGQVPESVINTRVGNILRTLFRFGFFDRAAFPSDGLIDQEAHALVARDNVEQGMVLLKNDGLLPLNVATLKSLAIIGSVAETNVSGGGSSTVVSFAPKTPRASITERAGSDVTVTYHSGTTAAAAAAVAAAADVALVFVRDTAAEGQDKTCLSLDCGPLMGVPGPTTQDDLIRAVAAANPRTVVIMQTSGPVRTPWRNEVGALIEAWYAGQEAGTAMARVLFGDTEPGGRLPLSFMDAEGDTPVAGDASRYPGIDQRTVYSEGVFTGYRWHDENAVAPAYPFGHGLSYTRFSYSNLRISDREISATVRNIGERTGSEVAQLYIGMPDPSPNVLQPPRWLKGFQRVQLTPGSSATVRFPLDARTLAYWNVETNGWETAAGCYEISVGASSRDLPLQGQLCR